jgi:uncharacterized protein YjbI with pentapeptide repeats
MAASLSGADLSQANLSGADLDYANLRGTRLSEADLTDLLSWQPTLNSQAADESNCILPNTLLRCAAGPWRQLSDRDPA